MPGPAPLSPRHKLIFLGIVALGAALRLWTIGAGLPYTIGVDEPALMGKSIHIMKSGDFHPHFWDYPGFTIYLQTAVACVRFLSGAMDRQWASLGDVWEGDFYLWARVVTALIGTVTVIVVFRAGLRWGTTVALIAAFAMAVQPQHVRESHFALTDTPLTFFAALTLLLSLRAAESGRLRDFLLAGLGAGLAAATKYNGALAILMPAAVALVSADWRARMTAGLVAFGGAAIGFVAAAPYSLIDLPGFLDGFARLMQHYNRPRPFSEVSITYLKYVMDWFGYQALLPRMAALPAILLYLAGVIVLLFDLRRPATRAAALAVLVFPPVYFWFVSNQSLLFGRYLMPIVPMLSIGVALGIVTARDVLTRKAPAARRRLVMAALLVVLVPPFLTSLSFNLNRRLVTTEEQTGRWIEANVKRDERIVFEATIQLPPRLKHERVLRLIADPLERYRQDGTVYLVASSAEYGKFFQDPIQNAHQIGQYNDIFRSTELVQVFTPTNDHPGPTIRIMRLVR